MRRLIETHLTEPEFQEVKGRNQRRVAHRAIRGDCDRSEARKIENARQKAPHQIGTHALRGTISKHARRAKRLALESEL
jgi:hypothetical protein